MIKSETGVWKKRNLTCSKSVRREKYPQLSVRDSSPGAACHRKGEAESGLSGFASPKTNGEGDFMQWTSTFARQERSQWVSSDKRALNSLAAFANRLRRLRTSLGILLHSSELFLAKLKACLL
ncbi:hypothetical protein TNCT_558231 [Trichonephila clavata]|uniref:Uncharacterized protein n=1 Tax=Trichonephila clavata TaxID=2740835 RepID=A0A8X6LYB8_TRICU|nr:hypothetical protein TNCT_558231 [Trichonephila clavata]